MNMQAVRAQRQAIAALARRHGVAEVWVFGSTARDTAGEASDLDLLVRLEPGRSLLDRAAFRADVEALLGVRVDVANPATLHPLIRDQVQREAQAI